MADFNIKSVIFSFLSGKYMAGRMGLTMIICTSGGHLGGLSGLVLKGGFIAVKAYI